MFYQRRDTDQLKRNRKVSINDKFIVECMEGESIYQVLTDSGFTFLGHCGGKGICGKCFVRVKPLCGASQKTDRIAGEEDVINRAPDSKEETVLACQYDIQKDIAVYTGNLWQDIGNNKMTDAHNGTPVESRITDIGKKADRQTDNRMAENIKNIGVAVDLGSTTIVVSCMDLEKKEEITAFSFTNPQYAYGADVISRIRFCMEDEQNLLMLGQIVETALKEQLIEKLGTEYSHIAKIVYSGNTTMLHILRGFSVEGLSRSPFMPVSTDYEAVEKNAVKMIYPPGFSAFVGADILTGAEVLEIGKQKAYDLLVDLGTNGEILLLNKDSGVASATACGPVFDSAVKGAVYGSESIKAIANCIKRRLVDKTGKIAGPYFEKGITIDKGFVISQENIRNFQLAKGAIYAGIQCLLRKAGITADDIANVYISGGLGFHMDIWDAFTVKMLPEAFRNKITISGNTSLEGAKKLVTADKWESAAILSEYEAIKRRTKSLELANLEGFQEIYMQSMDF
ncbi:MAG: DUF4445 domain-containing protein [Lachnospiraceae bacterium]|nr:DUF4445 domain-containing protein [Lachnospiraceae bacterium]